MIWFVALLGGVGAVARFVVDGAIRGRLTHVLPVGTMTVNVTGSLLIGLLAGAAAYHGLGANGLLLGATGFCGGYTTFSTAMVETVRLASAGKARQAAVTALGSLALCVGAAAAGLGLMAVTA